MGSQVIFQPPIRQRGVSASEGQWRPSSPHRGKEVVPVRMWVARHLLEPWPQKVVDSCVSTFCLSILAGAALFFTVHHVLYPYPCKPLAPARVHCSACLPSDAGPNVTWLFGGCAFLSPERIVCILLWFCRARMSEGSASRPPDANVAIVPTVRVIVEFVGYFAKQVRGSAAFCRLLRTTRSCPLPVLHSSSLECFTVSSHALADNAALKSILLFPTRGCPRGHRCVRPLL